jgi:predicted acylesterase/phospholipase RssA
MPDVERLMPKLRIGLTISGAVSLGAYEGGALAALLLAVQRMQGAVVIDAITGASAGAMTAVLAARCLLRGIDPVEAMKQAWVDLPSLRRLASRDLGSPLSGQVLQEVADE